MPHTFPEPLSFYKRKDDLVALSGVLSLKTSGTVSELSTQLKVHLSVHSEIQQNSRFSGLFLTHWHRIENVLLLDE